MLWRDQQDTKKGCHDLQIQQDRMNAHFPMHTNTAQPSMLNLGHFAVLLNLHFFDLNTFPVS